MPSTALQRIDVDDAMPDSALVALAKDGNGQAVRILVRRHNRKLFRLARSIVRNDGEAEDIVQATYVKAFTHLSTFRGDAAFVTWLTRITMNESLGRYRRSSPTVNIAAAEEPAVGNGAEVIMFPTISSTPSPESEADREKIRRFLERAIDQLDESFRTVLIMRDIEGMSIQETAILLEIRPETVKTRLHRARARLRRAIEGTIAPQFSDLFPFDGARCDRMADVVCDEVAREDEDSRW